MTTPNQKADARPISFVLHDMAKGTDPVEVPLQIRPEDLSKSDLSRLNVVQTMGGAYVDNFGPGLPSLQISGHTGWGAGSMKDGLAQFQNLRSTIFDQWHALRADAAENNLNPDKVKLIFADKLDDIACVVAPQTFVLRRSKSRPLLSMYQITMTWLSADVKETLDALEAAKASTADEQKRRGIASLIGSIQAIAKSLNSKINALLGPVKNAAAKLANLTHQVLTAVKDVVTAVLSVPATLAVQLIETARSLTKAASNIYHSVAAIASIPMIVKAYAMEVAAEFENAFCVLSNVFKPRLLLPSYDDLYGSSNCSSTSGGAPLSIYQYMNPFSIYQKPRTGTVLVLDGKAEPVSSEASAELSRLSAMDPVNPYPNDQINLSVDKVASGFGGANG